MAALTYSAMYEQECTIQPFGAVKWTFYCSKWLNLTLLLKHRWVSCGPDLVAILHVIYLSWFCTPNP